MNDNLCVLIISIFMLSNMGNTLADESMKLNENDAGKTVEIAVGDALEIILPANPTTGYVWEVNSLGLNVLRLGETNFINDTAIGSSGMEVIKFQAIAAGKSTVKLIFHRPFEQNIPPLKTFEVTVIIKQ
jgi:inhibitor of cysteine peptidase